MRGGERVDHGAGGLANLRQRRRTIEHEDRIDVAVVEQRRKGIGIALPARVADDVDRIAAAPGRGQEPVQISHSIGG